MNISSTALKQLHHVHECLAELRSRLARGPAQVRASEAKLQRLEKEVAEAKEAVTKCKLATAERELQFKERENRILDIQGKLNSCTNNKEYQALIERIAADEQANSVLSDEILELYEKISSLEGGDHRSERAAAEVATTIWPTLRERVAKDRTQLGRRDREDGSAIDTGRVRVAGRSAATLRSHGQGARTGSVGAGAG